MVKNNTSEIVSFKENSYLSKRNKTLDALMNLPEERHSDTNPHHTNNNDVKPSPTISIHNIIQPLNEGYDRNSTINAR
ncbi:hypothetical protein RclHR1_09160008 [Rhizophagus clarus]|uniref:Uncharacterized protein n=1 Tax=Rhizophagus clarus TaxID=94130 RepID=A0A2Z6SGY3_9GLOM|nr:hypothetical protein RclHR1_09160008 [Rhizophagus clarus]GET04576.1 hypothetical protein RCL_jg7975.t1 [Rhizophagus clarus]